MILTNNTTLFSSNIDTQAIKDLVSVFTAAVTILITYLMGRPVFVKSRKRLSIYLVSLWFLAIIIYVIFIFHIDISMFFLAILIGPWFFILILIFTLFYNVLNLETTPFSKKTSLHFDKFINCPFGSKCIDKAIKEKEQNKNIFPLIIMADESWKPWNIGQNFIITGCLKTILSSTIG